MRILVSAFRSTLLFAAALVLFTACGDEPTELVTQQPPEDDPPAQQVDDSYASDDPVPSEYERVEPRVELLSPTPAPIGQLVVGADGSTVLVRYTNAAEPCSGARVTVTETESTVEVSLQTGLDPNAAAMSCIAAILPYEIAVPLDAALGDRQLVAVEPGPGEAAGDPFEGAEFPTDQYLGLTEAEAMDLGEIEQRIVRVARIDDERLMLTTDFSPTRVNLEIEDGIVVLATSG